VELAVAPVTLTFLFRGVQRNRLRVRQFKASGIPKDSDSLHLLLLAHKPSSV